MTASMAREGGDFRVAGWIHALGGFVERRRPLWVRLGDLETRVLGDRLRPDAIEIPVYIAGLARAGTTILLEALAQHPDVATHQYRDYPPVYTPFWWSRLLDHIETRPQAAAERAHRDRIMVTPASPEAMEEVLWMTFFPDCHDPATSAVLDGRVSNPAFERFYREHVAKLLLTRGRRRYVAKGNYNVTRLQYIQKIFPTARFIVPVRRPEAHVASLVKQHRLFCAGVNAHGRAYDHLRRVGHFEFGPDRRPVNVGNACRTSETMELWQQGDEVRGWARQWADVYGFVADVLASDPKLRAATLVVRYEDLCSIPLDTLARAFEHAALDGGRIVAASLARTISAPSYYEPHFSAADLATIRRETCEAAGRFGYSDRNSPAPEE